MERETGWVSVRMEHLNQVYTLNHTRIPGMIEEVLGSLGLKLIALPGMRDLRGPGIRF